MEHTLAAHYNLPNIKVLEILGLGCSYVSKVSKINCRRSSTDLLTAPQHELEVRRGNTNISENGFMTILNLFMLGWI